nr:hypothetical protein [Haloferax larsenii]
MVQLEYWHDETWNEVVRYDHDEDAPGGHDVAAEGLHRDVYRNGEKAVVEDVTGPIDANEGYSIAEDDLTEDLEYYTQRYERWHNLTPPTNQSPTNSTT